MESKSYKIIRSWRKSISIEVSRSRGVIVRAPFFLSEKAIFTFVSSKSDWIEKHVSQFGIKRERSADSIFYLGKEYPLRFISDSEMDILWNGKEFLLSEKTKNSIQDYLIKWYKKEAIGYFEERIQYFACEYNFKYNTIKITSAQRRWGSCSSKNDINFPWRLLMAPRETIDYVVIHELAHTVHKNHSDRFWGLVESIIPNWKKHREHLRKEGWKYDIPNKDATR